MQHDSRFCNSDRRESWSPTHLQRLRLLGGLRQSDLADRAGLSRDTISRLEHGKSQPRLSTARRIAEALNLPVAACWPGQFEAEPMPAVRQKIDPGIRYLLRVEAAIAGNPQHEELLLDTQELVRRARESGWPL